MLSVSRRSRNDGDGTALPGMDRIFVLSTCEMHTALRSNTRSLLAAESDGWDLDFGTVGRGGRWVINWK
jgi:hypothetical protein